MNSDEETIVENKPPHTELTFNEHVGLKMSKLLETIGGELSHLPNTMANLFTELQRKPI